MINWDEYALNSEIEFSKALLSQPVEYPDFIHMYNPFVPWGGDFNRALNIKVTGLDYFEHIVSQIKRVHQEKGLDKPDRFDIRKPVLDEMQWTDSLLKKGFTMQAAIFFNSPTKMLELPSGYTLYAPSETEYFDWYAKLTETRGYFDDNWYKLLLPLQANFIQVFKPNWLLKDKDLIGWVYSAYLGNYCRLFEVEVVSHFQGMGMGRLLLQEIICEGYRQGAEYILLQSNAYLKPFYEKCGFKECSRNSIIRLIE